MTRAEPREAERHGNAPGPGRNSLIHSLTMSSELLPLPHIKTTPRVGRNCCSCLTLKCVASALLSKATTSGASGINFSTNVMSDRTEIS